MEFQVVVFLKYKISLKSVNQCLCPQHCIHLYLCYFILVLMYRFIISRLQMIIDINEKLMYV